MASNDYASNDPFDIASSRTIAPVTCTDCGNNMYCFRRSPAGCGERQWFLCSGCGEKIERTVGLQPSDTAIQSEAEKIAGIDARERK